MNKTRQRIAVVTSASGGIGRALTARLADAPDVAHVFALSRGGVGHQHERVTQLTADATDPQALAAAASRVGDAAPRVHLLITCGGLLHGGAEQPRLKPEKSLDALDPANFREVMAVNALAPLQVLGAFKRLLVHGEGAVAGLLSAQVGSIGDNRLGGWYSYRMSKAALNMGVRCAAIELGRGRRGEGAPVVVAIHPGTTVSYLSEPFIGRHTARPAADSARHILEVLDALSPEDSGRFLNWDGRGLPW